NSETGNGSTIVVFASCSPAAPLPWYGDGRLNVDPGQLATVYCANGEVAVYRIIQSVGYLSLRVSQATIAKGPKYPARNTLIAEDHHYKVRLYRLTSGELQINATSYESGKNDYVFIWPGCTPNG